jgi:LEA14-like dessication related protein
MNRVRWQRLILCFVFLLSLSGCIEQPELKGFSNFKVDQFNKNKVSFSIDVKLFNPNAQNLKLRGALLDIYIDERYIGKAKLLEKIKLKRKSTTESSVPVEMLIEDGMLFKLMRIAMSGKTVDVRFNGLIKASASIIPVRKKIDETRPIDLSKFNLKGLLNRTR